MVVKEERLKLKKLLCETISLLCRSELTHQPAFHIEALIGITLEEDDVLLISFKETIRSSEGTTVTDYRQNHCTEMTLIDDEELEYVTPNQTSEKKIRRILIDPSITGDSVNACELFAERNCAPVAEDEIKTFWTPSSAKGAPPKRRLGSNCASDSGLSYAHAPTVHRRPVSSQNAADKSSGERQQRAPDSKLFATNVPELTGYIPLQCDAQEICGVNLIDEEFVNGDIDSIENNSRSHHQSMGSNGSVRVKEEIASSRSRNIERESNGLRHAASGCRFYGEEIAIKEEIQDDIMTLTSARGDDRLVFGTSRSRRTKRALSDTFSPYNSPADQDDLYMSSEALGQQLLSYDPATLHQSPVEPAGNNYQCHICSATLRGRRTLHDHIRGTHLCVYMYRCPHCGVTFKWRSGLKRHRPKCHLASNDGRY